MSSSLRAGGFGAFFNHGYEGRRCIVLVSEGIRVAEMHAFYRKEAAGGSMCMAPSGCLPCICLILVFSLTSSFFAFCHCLFFHSSGASHVRANIEPCTPQSSERQITRVNIPHSFFLSLLFFLHRMALPPDDAKFFLPPARPLHIDSLTLAVWQPPPSFLRRLYSLW